MNDTSQRMQDQKDAKGAIIKEMVRCTFEKLSIIESMLSDLQKVKSSIKRDLSDMAEGRIDRIVERQQLDNVSAKEGTFSARIKVEIGSKTTSPWYVPYLVSIAGEEYEINNSLAKTYAKGSYKLENGEIKYL